MKSQVVSIFVIIAVLVAYLFTLNGQENTNDEITVEEVRDKLATEEEVILIDVRTEPEFDGSLGHLPGAILIPLAELEKRIEELETYREKELIIYCRSGNRSGKATKILRDQDYNAANMVGGMLAWNKMKELSESDSSEVRSETISE